MTIVCIGGLPGSGKTHYGKSLAESLDVCFFDDMDDNQLLELKKVMAAGKGAVITDTRFCLKDVRVAAAEILRGCEIRWILFENDVEACRKNVERRNDGRKVSEHIYNLWRAYDAEGVKEIIPVWKGM